MKLLFILSGGHGTLPYAEASSVMETFFDVKGKQKGALAFFEINMDNEKAEKAFGRLCMTHSVLEFLGSCGESRVGGLIRKTVKDADTPFSVRVKSADAVIRKTEGRLADMIWDCLEEKGVKPEVDLEMPKTAFCFIFSGGSVFLGRLLWKRDRRAVRRFSPAKRPYRRPITMDPHLARAMVNLARCAKGSLLDPFCGTGGILLEAASMGLEVYGSDADGEMVLGSERNFSHFSLPGNFRKGDATGLKKVWGRRFDCIVTDFPYGRLASLRKSNAGELYPKSLESMGSVLRKGGFAVVMTPNDINLKTEMKLIETHTERVNRSLSRKIWVFRKR